jgi:hypothetical protein
MHIPESMQLVDPLVTDSASGTKKKAETARALTQEALRLLLPEVERRTQLPGAAVFDDCCNTCNGLRYYHECHEIRMWYVGLMFAEYVAGLIADKAKIGHCHAKKKINRHCSMGRALHLKMLARFKQDLAEVIQQITELEKDEPNWPKAESHAHE